MGFVVIYDPNVLYPSTLRDLLVHVALTPLVQARWTEQILDETFRSLARKRPDLDPARLRRTRELINLDDFPAGALTRWDVEAKHPDDFLVDQFHLDALEVHKAVQAVANSWRNPPGTADDVLDSLERQGIPQTAALLRR